MCLARQALGEADRPEEWGYGSSSSLVTSMDEIPHIIQRDNPGSTWEIDVPFPTLPFLETSTQPRLVVRERATTEAGAQGTVRKLS